MSDSIFQNTPSAQKTPILIKQYQNSRSSVDTKCRQNIHTTVVNKNNISCQFRSPRLPIKGSD